MKTILAVAVFAAILVCAQFVLGQDRAQRVPITASMNISELRLDQEQCATFHMAAPGVRSGDYVVPSWPIGSNNAHPVGMGFRVVGVMWPGPDRVFFRVCNLKRREYPFDPEILSGRFKALVIPAENVER